MFRNITRQRDRQSEIKVEMLLVLVLLKLLKSLMLLLSLFLLSTVSSCLSSSSALVWTDIVHPLAGDIGERKATIVAKVSGIYAAFLSFV